jgi:hypothetical protein
MTIDTSFHRAFDRNGLIRQGYQYSDDTNEIVSSCSEQEVVNYLIEDLLLSDQDIHDKVNKIQKKWSSISLAECTASIHLRLQRLDPLNRKALAIFLRQFPNLTVSDADKETNYFILVLDQLRSLNPESAGKLEPFLTSDPHKIPLFIKLLENQQTELCDYLITATKDADRIGSRKLIQAIVNRRGDPHFNETIKGIKELLRNPQIELRWVAKLIKHDLFLELKRKSPEFLSKVVSQPKEHISKGIPILRYHRTCPAFVESHFITMLQRDFQWCQYFDGNRHHLRIAEFLLNIPHELFNEVSTVCMKSSQWTSLFMIYEKDIKKILKIQRSGKFKTLFNLAPLIRKAGLDTWQYEKWNRFTGIAEENWPFVEADYWIKKELKGDYNNYQRWLSSFGERKGCNQLVELIVSHLWGHPDQFSFYSDLKPDDAGTIVRLMSGNVDPASLKEDWQRKLLLRIARGNDFSPKKMNRFIHLLLNQPRDVCSMLAGLHDNSPGLFNALLKVGANPSRCSPENFEWFIEFAEKNQYLTAEMQRLFGYRLQVNETSRMPNLNQLIDAMRRYPGNLRQALIVFSRNPQAFYEHISESTRWDTEILTQFHEDYFSINPTETKRLIDGCCRLAAMNEWEILGRVAKLIREKNYRQAQQLTNLVFIGKKDLALELIQLPESAEPYLRQIAMLCQGFSTEIEDYLALHSHQLFRQLVLTERIGFNRSFAQAFRKLSPEDQEAAYFMMQKVDLNPSERIYKELLLNGNGVLFSMLLHSETFKIEDFLHLDFKNSETQKYVEQVLIFAEVISRTELLPLSPYLHFCLYAPKDISIHDALSTLSKLTCLVSMRQISQMDLNLKSTKECIRMINKTFSQFISNFFEPVRKLTRRAKDTSLNNRIETCLTDRLSELLVLKNHRLNLGLCEVFKNPVEGFPPTEDESLFHFDPYFKTMLNQLANDRDLQTVITTIRMRNLQDSHFKKFVKKCTGSKDQLTDRDLQKAVVAAMLSRLKQGKLGSCFCTHLSIQIQNSYPLMKAQDLKNIVENEVLKRPSGEYPLILPSYIFEKEQRSENGLLQVWDFSLGNMAGQEERMFKRIADPVHRLVVKALNKVNAQSINEFSRRVIERLKHELYYVYDADKVSKKGIFVLHKGNVSIQTVEEFLHIAQKIIGDFAREESGAAAEVLEYLCHEVFAPSNAQKWNQLLAVEPTEGTTKTRLVEKGFIKAITNFPGGYGASVLRNYFGIRNLYEETFTAHSAKETLENLLDMHSSLPQDAIVSYFTMGHVSSLLKDVPTLKEANIDGMMRLGASLRMQPIGPYLKEMNQILKHCFEPTEVDDILEQLKEKIDLSRATIGEYFHALPQALEVVTVKADHEAIYDHMDNVFMSKEFLRTMLPIIHVVYTNWFQKIQLEDNKVGFDDIHFGFGYRISRGDVGIYKVSNDESIVTALSLRETMKTHKIRFIIK